MLKKLLLPLTLVATAGCADVATTTKTSAPARPDVISYCDMTLHTVPEGAAINVDGRFFGYSPVSWTAKLVNGYPPEPIYVQAVPTAPGQFTQVGSIGWAELLGFPGTKPFGSTASYTLYMYNTQR
jgi:hypothetical protein